MFTFGKLPHQIHHNCIWHKVSQVVQTRVDHVVDNASDILFFEHAFPSKSLQNALLVQQQQLSSQQMLYHDEHLRAFFVQEIQGFGDGVVQRTI